MYFWIAGALAVLAALIYSYVGTHPQGVIDGEHEGDVRALVSSFSNQMDSVSLLAPDAAETIRKAYEPYVAPALIKAWAMDPLSAPGRLTSSPSPDFIEIGTVTETSPNEYAVTGEIVLVTSTGDAGRVPVSLTVESIDGHFLITQYVEQGKSEPEESGSADITVALGEEAAALGITMRPSAVLEDSRCPTDVQCIQAGTVRIDAAVSFNQGEPTTEQFELGTAKTVQGAVITLFAVTPDKTQAIPLTDADYRFTFHIERP